MFLFHFNIFLRGQKSLICSLICKLQASHICLRNVLSTSSLVLINRLSKGQFTIVRGRLEVGRRIATLYSTFHIYMDKSLEILKTKIDEDRLTEH